MLRLDPRVHVDVTDLRLTAEQFGQSPSGKIELSSDGFEVELLPDWPDDWITEWRESWRQVRLHALEALSRVYASAGWYGRALDVALAAVRAEPLRESAHRAVIEIHVAEGNVNEALRQYRMCEVLLQQELGVAPSSAILDLLPPPGAVKLSHTERNRPGMSPDVMRLSGP